MPHIIYYLSYVIYNVLYIRCYILCTMYYMLYVILYILYITYYTYAYFNSRFRSLGLCSSHALGAFGRAAIRVSILRDPQWTPTTWMLFWTHLYKEYIQNRRGIQRSRGPLGSTTYGSFVVWGPHFEGPAFCVYIGCPECWKLPCYGTQVIVQAPSHMSPSLGTVIQAFSQMVLLIVDDRNPA